MERYGSDVEVDEQRTPLIRRGREEEVQKGERKKPKHSANNAGASVVLCSICLQEAALINWEEAGKTHTNNLNSTILSLKWLVCLTVV